NTNAATDSGDDRFAAIATDASGNWVVVWESTDDLGGTIGTDRDILVAGSADNGTTWTAPAVLNSNAATDAADDSTPRTPAVAAALRDALAVFNSNAATDAGDDRFARIATDAAGTWVVVWMSEDSLGGTIGTDFDVLYAVSTDDGATWTAPAALNSNAATD